MYISKRVHSVKVTHLPWAQAPPCLRTERKARHTVLGRVERILCGVVARMVRVSARLCPLTGVAAAWLTRWLGRWRKPVAVTVTVDVMMMVDESDSTGCDDLR